MGGKKNPSRVCTALLTVLTVVFGSIIPVYAMDARNNSGGIYDETKYQEVIFVTGKPIVVTGKIDARQTVRNGTGTLVLRYDLENIEESVKLTCNITFSINEEKRDKQTITTMEIRSFSEKIQIGDNDYQLDDFQFTKSVIADDRPAADYFTGNWSGRKIYDFNRGNGTVEVFFQGRSVGYENPWSTAETQNISGTVAFKGNITVGEAVYSDDWSGTFRTDVSYSTGSEIIYQPNDVLAISFPGGYVLVREAGSALTYNARFPELDANGRSRGGWDSWSDTLSRDSFPVYQRLPVYGFNDMTGHWAKSDVEILTGLGVMSAGNYFGPTINMTRGEFARALAKALELTDGEETKTAPARRITLPWGNPLKEDTEDEFFFEDVRTDHPYYKDIKAVYENNLLTGTGNGRFSPDEPLTRAQAITAFIRALGFKNHGTVYAVPTFRDAGSIPDWAKEAFFTAGSIGLISGDAFGYANPNQNLTRAEGAALLHRFIVYLQDDLRYEYRDRVLNY